MNRVLFVCCCLSIGLSGCGKNDAHESENSDGAIVGDVSTWTEGVGSLLNRECGACHQEGGIAPFATDYESAVQWSSAIKVAVQNRSMPPMPVTNSGDCQTYRNARWLSDEEIAQITAWVDAGAPLGEGEFEAIPPSLPTLERADETLVSPKYLPDDEADDDYRCFPITPGVDGRKFITEYEVIPGDPRVVHHVILFQASADEVAKLDAADEGLGYRCFGQATATSLPVVLWAPGGGAVKLPAGTGLPYDSENGYVIQVHYNVAQGAHADPGTEIRLKLEDAVAEEGAMIPILDFAFSLEPQQESVSNAPKPGFITGMPTFPGGFTLYSTGPHMHTLGRTQRVVATQDGAETCIAQVDRWDFDWQQGWAFTEPIEFPADKGDVQFRIDCSWNTMGRNETVRWGDGTQDEMCLNFVYATGLSFSL